MTHWGWKEWPRSELCLQSNPEDWRWDPRFP